jgi:ribosomal protein S18 acetylase RimI-like enzyme
MSSEGRVHGPVLVSTTRAHLHRMMDWFVDRDSCAVWSPNLRFPFNEETFAADTMWETLPSYSLVNPDGELLGFGQYYDRLGRCHLGRLVIAPAHRGKGLGAHLIRSLVARGAPLLGASECSLFVSHFNPAAARLYARLGFTVTPYPDGAPIPDCDYMIAPCSRILGPPA